ncbi:MAG: dihydroorotase [Flavobacteriaceae bacterium]
MATTLIKGAYLVNEGQIKKQDLRIKGEKIAAIGTSLNPLDDETIIDAQGKYLFPGLIDDQVHFREPGLTHKACIFSESRAAVAGGITSFIEMPNTVPQTTTVEKFDEKLAIAKENSLANYSFMFGGTNDNFDEIRRLDKTKVAGLKLFLGSSTGNMLVDNEQVLKKIFSNTDLVIAVHCEDEPTVQHNLATYVERFGEDIPIEMHPEIRSREACYLSSSKAIALAKETGARLHVFHLSTAEETDLFDNSIPLEQKKITAEVCVHHLWFSSEDYAQKGTHIKWNPAVKNSTDRSALWAALNDDRIDVLATDHAPHTLEEKANVYTKAPSGGPLVQHALLALLSAAKQDKISLEKIVQKACHNPAILFQIAHRGYLREGYQADLVLIDLEKQTTVTKENLLYQCGWSPFEGTTFEAAIDQTWVNGQLVYAEGKIIESDSAQQLTFNR